MATPLARQISDLFEDVLQGFDLGMHCLTLTERRDLAGELSAELLSYFRVQSKEGPCNDVGE